MDKAKYQEFVDDLNELVKKHGLALHSGNAHYRLELAPVGSDDNGVAVILADDESGGYHLED